MIHSFLRMDEKVFCLLHFSYVFVSESEMFFEATYL